MWFLSDLSDLPLSLIGKELIPIVVIAVISSREIYKQDQAISREQKGEIQVIKSLSLSTLDLHNTI